MKIKGTEKLFVRYKIGNRFFLEYMRNLHNTIRKKQKYKGEMGNRYKKVFHKRIY